MELVLNLVWLALVIGMASLWWTRWLPTIRRGARLPSAVALCCFLSLMFYVISMTDDLHEEIVFMEEAASSRNWLHVVHAPAGDRATGARFSPQAIAWAVRVNTYCPVVAGRVEVELAALPLESLRIILPPRAPPQSAMSSL
jgi:hypothetical protein